MQEKIQKHCLMCSVDLIFFHILVLLFQELFLDLQAVTSAMYPFLYHAGCYAKLGASHTFYACKYKSKIGKIYWQLFGINKIWLKAPFKNLCSDGESWFYSRGFIY